jgi:hypothetical protein
MHMCTIFVIFETSTRIVGPKHSLYVKNTSHNNILFRKLYINTSTHIQIRNRYNNFK